MSYKSIETKLKNKCLINNNPYIPSNYYNIEQVLSIGDIHGDFTLLLNILFKCNIIKKCEKNNNSIHIKYKEYENTPLLDYYVEISRIYNNLLIIQIGDIMDIKKSKLKFVDNSFKILKFINKLSEKINDLNKNYHFISLYGNHELLHIENKYNKKINELKYNFICNYKLVVNVNDNYIFVHSGLVKNKIHKYFDKYINPNMKMKEKIEIFNIVFNDILLKNYLKNKADLLFMTLTREYERPEEYNIKPTKQYKGINVYNFNKYKCNKKYLDKYIKKYKYNIEKLPKISSDKIFCPNKSFNNLIEHYNFYTLNNMIIGHNSGNNFDIIEYDYNDKINKIFIIDNNKSRGYEKNNNFYNNDIPSALLIDTLTNNYSVIF